MSRVAALRPECLTPQILLLNALEESMDAKACFVVMIDKDNRAEVWNAGSIGELCLASQTLNTITQRYLRGEVHE